MAFRHGTARGVPRQAARLHAAATSTSGGNPQRHSALNCYSDTDFDFDNPLDLNCYLKDEDTECLPPFYIATCARANLTWSTFNSGDSAPTNAYQLHGITSGATRLDKTRAGV
jgi:hypothetical protein